MKNEDKIKLLEDKPRRKKLLRRLLKIGKINWKGNNPYVYGTIQECDFYDNLPNDLKKYIKHNNIDNAYIQDFLVEMENGESFFIELECLVKEDRYKLQFMDNKSRRKEAEKSPHNTFFVSLNNSQAKGFIIPASFVFEEYIKRDKLLDVKYDDYNKRKDGFVDLECRKEEFIHGSINDVYDFVRKEINKKSKKVFPKASTEIIDDNFVNLHCHSEFSLLDGMGKVRDILKHCKEIGQKSIALTEHGNMNSTLRAYIKSKELNIKFIPGIEVYLVKDMTVKGLEDKKEGDNIEERNKLKKERKKRNHLILLAKNEIGYKNLLKISSLGNIEGFYYRPRVDLDLINKYKKGLIVLSACIFGEISEKIIHSTEKDVIDTVTKYKKMFGDNFYLEIQPHKFEDQITANKKIIELAHKYKIKLVCTNDVHYIHKEDNIAQRTLTMLNRKITISKLEEDRLDNSGFHLKTRKETYDDFINTIGKDYSDDVNEALDNTVEIANSVNVEIDIESQKMPKFKDINVDIIIKKVINERWNEIKKKINKSEHKAYKERIKYEYDIIKNKGLIDFIYIIYDVVKWAQNNKIIVGVGRGSACGSLLCYLLDITKVDPIKHDLLFARFINVGRTEMPDIDIDFDSKNRSKIKEYLVGKYGKDRVSSIGAFGTFKCRGLLKDLARVYEKPLPEVIAATKYIPYEFSLKEAQAMPDVRRYIEKYPEIWEIALRLEGQVRHFSTHAAGIVISNETLYDHVPLCVYKNEIVTGWDEGSDNIKCISAIKMMKLDCLGLSTLSVIGQTIELIKKRKKKDLYKTLFYDLSLNDKEILKMADLGKTTGVFQFESRSIKDWLREIGVETFEHLVAVNALHRPAALKSGYAKKYAKRKNGMEKIDYLHPSLKKPLKRTYGLVVFQEDSMRIAKEVAGYTYEEADDLRKITSKGAKLVASGKGYLFDEAKEIFVKKCIDNGVDKDQASEIFKFIESFMDYAFNRAHAVAYSIISYQCLYLKKYYPLEFLISILNNASKEETLNDYKREVKRMGYELLNPNVNKSSDYFSIDSGGIRYGLSFIKNIGLKASTDIVKMAPYDSFDDFLDKVNRRVVNKRVIESLNKAGAFKCFNDYDESKYLKKVKQQCTN